MENPVHVPRTCQPLQLFGTSCFRVILSTKTGYGAYRSGDRLSMAGSGNEHFSSQRCIHIVQNNPASCTLINGDRLFIPQWQIGHRMKQANLCYYLLPWLRTPAVLPLIPSPLAQPAASIATDICITEATYPSTAWLPKLEVWKDYIHRGPVVLHNNLQTKLTAFLPQSRGWNCYVNTNTDTFPAPTAPSHWPSRTLPTCNISPGSLTSPAYEAGEFVKLLLL